LNCSLTPQSRHGGTGNALACMFKAWFVKSNKIRFQIDRAWSDPEKYFLYPGERHILEKDVVVQEVRPMFFRRFLSARYPALDWIQVEITSHCNAACTYCPQSAFRLHWQKRHLPLEYFRRLLPAFTRTGFIHLQGWGEPFCHPEFPGLIQMAKDRGLRVGTTTNGMLLTEESVERLVDAGLDILGFSLAGLDESNDRIRKGTHLKKVIRAIEDINRLKARKRVEYPHIHLAYMLLRSGRSDLQKLPEFSGNLGVTQVVVSSLSMVVHPELESESVLVTDKVEYHEFAGQAAQLRQVAARQGVSLEFHVATPFSERTDCSENIGRSLVIGSDGTVTPCVMTNIPVSNGQVHYFQGSAFPLAHYDFGRVMDESLAEIWRKKEYRRFRHSRNRGDAETFCRHCLKRFIDPLSPKSDSDLSVLNAQYDLFR